MKVKRLRITWELFNDWFTAGSHKLAYSVIQGAVPADAQLVNVRHGWPNLVELLLSSETFDEVPKGAEIPELPIVFQSIYD